LLNFKKGALKDEEKPNIHFNKVSLLYYMFLIMLTN